MTRIPINDDNEMQDLSGEGDDAGTQSTDGASGASAEFEALKADRDSLYQRLARATAEFKNSQRRMEQDFEQQKQYSNSTVIKSLLPVIDNFERALGVDGAKADAATVLKGLQIVHDQLMSVLRQQKVEEINPAPGTPFDPNQHEALLQQEAEYKVPTVVQLLQKGYALHGRTLRPAQVAVSKSA